MAERFSFRVPGFSLAFTSGSQVAAAFLTGVVDVLRGPLAQALDGVIQIQSGPTIAHARDQLTRMFLEHSKAPVLVVADADMGISTPHVAALLALTGQAGVVGARYSGSIPVGRPGGAEQRVAEAGYWRGGYVPLGVIDPAAELVDVDVVGAGLIAIRRDVFADVAKCGPGEPMPWWSAEVRDGAYVEEDFTFCLRAKAAGHRVALAARVLVPHMKMVGV